MGKRSKATRFYLAGATSVFMISGACAEYIAVKAKGADYVKICSAYGAGYYYIPGTDTCLKIGGYVRLDTYVNAVSPFNPEIVSTATFGFNGPGTANFGYPFKDADDSDYLTRARGVVDMDARSQTDYGTLRSYLRFGMNWDSQSGPGLGTGSSLYFERAFIQLAGFTFGYTQSFFDPGIDYMYATPYAGSNTWTTVLAYTATLGSGLSATLSLEDAANRTTGVQMAGSTAQPVFAVSTVATGLGYTNYQAGQTAPDVVANLRLDQSWGSAQLSGALHQVAAVLPAYAGFVPGIESTSSWGWALGASIEVKLPMLAAGDSFFVQAGYEQGAVNYVGLAGFGQGRSVAVGTLDLTQVASALTTVGAFYTVADAIATNALGDFDLTSGWAVQGQFRHFWTPSLRSAAFAGYLAYEAPRNVVAAFDFNMWQAGFNTIWSPVKNLDIGTEIVYSKVDGSVPLAQYTAITGTGGTQGSLVGGSADIWSGGMRVQRNF